ncbi:hydantoinase B/oxoprolinase family protein [Acuticoccus mangrovi]|uniref:Hydantoinase B/oxoprolinase family protein n=1 Tax=Acuticoccus mangrovi TaxID=2796142 RepID=A0A934MFC2_9HYPH|nr:hydantoinase B/oxoprolinase family protein [Acuticoccus mangrovi]MBJ3778512.1 hydantoinase B/oxoprolinase family protein [Acuticoccus mangrovi]
MALDVALIESGIKPVPPTQEELDAAEALQVGDYEIFSENLVLIAQEGKEVMTKMGISSMLHSGDTMVGIYTAAGDLVTTVCGTLLHSVTGQIPIKYIIKHFTDDPSVGVREGDVYYTNEALYGGIHNPDQFAIMPVFVDGELLAWVVSGAHQSETGGSEPGGEIPAATTRHDEGMKLTPIKIGENYRLRTDLLNMMENFISRAPRMQVTDVKARVAACDRVRQRVQAMAARRGTATMKGLFRKMIQETSSGVHQRVARWVDGTYRHTVFMDTTGHEDSLLRASVTLTVKDGKLSIDFEGSSPEHEGSYNAFASVIRAHCAVILFELPFNDFPMSSGMMEHIEIAVPKGSFFDAGPEAAISCSPLVGGMVFPLLGVVLSKAMYSSEQRDQVCGYTSSSASAVMVSGTNQHGVRVTDFMGYPLNAYGLGARCDQDGVDVFGFPHGPWGKAPDVEDIESEFPLLHLYQRQMTDTCGYGKYRGGVGASIAYIVRGSPYVAFTSSQKESKFPAHNGLFGGYSMSTLPGIQVRGTDALARMAAGDPNIPTDDYELAVAEANKTLGGEVIMEHQTRGIRVLAEGDILAASTQGSGGYGDVLERDPASVAEDLRKEVITLGVARDVYGVIVDPQRFLVDEEATAARRQEMRQARGAKAKPYGEWVKSWEAKRPPDQALKWFGTWPDAKPNRDVVRI